MRPEQRTSDLQLIDPADKPALLGGKIHRGSGVSVGLAVEWFHAGL